MLLSLAFPHCITYVHQRFRMPGVAIVVDNCQRPRGKPHIPQLEIDQIAIFDLRSK